MSRKIRNDDDQRLIDLCMGCSRMDCDGTCREYRDMEKAIAAGEEIPEKKRPGIVLEPVRTQRRRSGEEGLRLYNMIIDMLEDLKEQSDSKRKSQIDMMLKAMRTWRMETFEAKIDWYALEE